MKGVFTIAMVAVWSIAGSPSKPICDFRHTSNHHHVILKTFDAWKEGATVLLTWTTACEAGNKGFYIERRVGDRPWESVSFVNSTAATGSSNAEISYSYTDHINYKVILRYRLKVADLNDNFEYSETRIVKNEASEAITIFPNPTTGNVNIAFADPDRQYDIRVYFSDGKLLNKWHNCRSVLTIFDLTPGIYIFKINEQVSKKESTHKVIVLNKQSVK